MGRVDRVLDHKLPSDGHVPRHARYGLALVLLSIIPTARGTSAQAQEPGIVQLDTITVTARKREESDQKVPISTSVLSGDRLAISPVQSNADLARSVPNFSFVDIGGQSANAANIRGVGSFNPLAADDTSVVFYVDEAPQSVYGLSPNLMDTERVEILRGPQGTLFGRNTQGGAVNIVSRKPTFDRSLAVTSEIGTSGYQLGELVANTPIVDSVLAGRLALRYSTSGGTIPNVAVGGKDGSTLIGAARGSLLFTPSDRTEALLTFNYNRQGDTSPRFLLRDAPNFPISAVNPRTKVDADAFGLNLRIKHDFDAFTLQSVTSIQNNTSTQRLDPTDGLVFAKITGLPPAFFNIPGSDLTNIRFDETIYQQELRLSSVETSAIAWTGGLNIFRSELSADRSGKAATPAFLSTNGLQANRFTTTSYAAFGEATVPVTDRLKATLGIRATHEDKSATYLFNGLGLPGVAPSFAQTSKLSDNFLTGRAALAYDWSENFMTYASIARGYVTGGFPAIAVNSYLGKPESAFAASTSMTYEAGFKSTWFDDRATLKGSLFFNDVKRGHLVAFNPTAAIFSVATLDYTSYGGELEATARVAPWLDLFGGIGYTHAELGTVAPGNPTGAKTGNRVPNVPEFNGNIGALVRVPGVTFGIPGEITGRLTYQYVGERAADVANSFNLKAYGLINAKLGWEKGDYSVYAFAYNLTDERPETWGQSFGTVPTVRVGQGRFIGLGATAKF